MQKGIIVRDGATLIEKCIYAGDVSEERMERELVKFRALYPTFTITLYNDDQDPEFLQA